LNIQTLIPDIYAEIEKNGIPEFTYHKPAEEQRKVGLSLSQMGPRCPCALWHSVHKPEMAQPLPPWAAIKYSYGHILEALAIRLARVAGHEVTGEQDELVVDGIVGHRDCVIDGCVVDVKSANSISFRAIKEKKMEEDAFLSGYLDQLDGYLLGSAEDPLVRVKDKGYILAIDKTLGHMVLYEHQIRPARIRDRIGAYKRIVAQDKPPPCECKDVEDGKSGNRRLDVRASYSPYKFCCRPNVRTFLYAEGPRYLTKVVRKPDVPEIDRLGNIVYN
jgi:hypothetical protein